MSRISTDDAFLMLAKWSVVRSAAADSPQEERAAIQFVMSRPGVPTGGGPGRTMGAQRAVSAAVVNEVMPHSQKVLLTLRDENGEDVTVTVNLEGAEWEYEDAGAVLPEFVEMKWVCFLAATFPNGNRYVFGERVKTAAG